MSKKNAPGSEQPKISEADENQPKHGRQKDGKDERIEEIERLQRELRQTTSEVLRLEQVLLQRDYKLRRIQEITNLGVFELDLHSPENDHWSEEFLRILGRSQSSGTVSIHEFIGTCVHIGDRTRVQKVLAEAIAEAIPFDLEYRISQPTGLFRHVHMRADMECDESGAVVRTIGTLQDITERVNAEDVIKGGREKFRAILETAVDAIITISQRGKIETVNKTAEKMFGYSADEMIGQNVKMLMPSPYREEHDGYLGSYLATGKRKIIGIGREVIGQRKDGSIFPMELAVSEVNLRNRQLFMGVVRDISARREMEKEVLSISESERRDIGLELHDGLGSLLTGVGLIAQGLVRKLTDEGNSAAAADASEVAGWITEADYMARNIARGLMPVSSEEDGLRLALQHMCETFTRIYEIDCVFEEVDEVRMVDHAITTHLYRIAQEAMTNSIKHGCATKITLRIGRSHVDDYIDLVVEDNGIGFPEQLPEIRGIGLRTMGYRANVIGAALSVVRGEVSGTVVLCRAPIGAKR